MAVLLGPLPSLSSDGGPPGFRNPGSGPTSGRPRPHWCFHVGQQPFPGGPQQASAAGASVPALLRALCPLFPLQGRETPAGLGGVSGLQTLPPPCTWPSPLLSLNLRQSLEPSALGALGVVLWLGGTRPVLFCLLLGVPGHAGLGFTPHSSLAGPCL